MTREYRETPPCASRAATANEPSVDRADGSRHYYVLSVQTDPGADLRGARRLLLLLQPSGKMPGGGRRERSAGVPAGAHGHYVPAAQDQVRMSRAVRVVRQRHVPAVRHAVPRLARRAAAQLLRGQVQSGRVRPRHAQSAHAVATLFRRREVQGRVHPALDATVDKSGSGRPVRGRSGVRALFFRPAVWPYDRRQRQERVRHAQLYDTDLGDRLEDE